MNIYPNRNLAENSDAARKLQSVTRLSTNRRPNRDLYGIYLQRNHSLLLFGRCEWDQHSPHGVELDASCLSVCHEVCDLLARPERLEHECQSGAWRVAQTWGDRESLAPHATTKAGATDRQLYGRSD
jgi:hypothetical protein